MEMSCRVCGICALESSSFPNGYYLIILRCNVTVFNVTYFSFGCLKQKNLRDSYKAIF